METLTLVDAYEYYKDNGGELDYKTWRSLCEGFNLAAVEQLLEGRRIILPAYMGYLQIAIVPKSFKHPNINWPASKKRKKELQEQGKPLYDHETGKGEKWIVYYIDEDWFPRFYWSKKFCRVPNKTVYEFRPTRGEKGAKTKLSRQFKQDELARYKYADIDDL